jgi:hypothetical protein
MAIMNKRGMNKIEKRYHPILKFTILYLPSSSLTPFFLLMKYATIIAEMAGANSPMNDNSFRESGWLKDGNQVPQAMMNARKK